MYRADTQSTKVKCGKAQNFGILRVLPWFIKLDRCDKNNNRNRSRNVIYVYFLYYRVKTYCVCLICLFRPQIVISSSKK